MIDGGLSTPDKRSLNHAAHGLTGTADLAYHFVARAHELTHPAGRIAFILPQSFLNAPSASGLRTTLAVERPPSAILVPRGRTSISRRGDVHLRSRAGWRAAVSQRSRLADSHAHLAHAARRPQQNWWRIISTPPSQHASRASHHSALLGEHFTITAGMTTGEAYEIREHLRDDRRPTTCG